MDSIQRQPIRIAVLDLYDGVANQGMRGIRETLQRFYKNLAIQISWDEFNVRQKNEIPDLSYDIFISSGGPGSPLETKDSKWEAAYFEWIQHVEQWNKEERNKRKKHIFFICHSFQLACRYYQIGNLCKRKSTAFGIFPVHLLSNGIDEPVFNRMQDPIYAVDSRDYQVIEPNHQQIQSIGASILAIEKERPQVLLERAIMAIRFNEYMIGTQFHPEADASGMSLYLQTEEKKKTVIENYGLEKWEQMITHLNDPDKISFTYSNILPNFLSIASNILQ
ncbi:MAG: GMP synthase [Chitinophagia bacterium]|nr:GMP synthase [Chitinophagia bacterium]